MDKKKRLEILLSGLFIMIILSSPFSLNNNIDYNITDINIDDRSSTEFLMNIESSAENLTVNLDSDAKINITQHQAFTNYTSVSLNTTNNILIESVPSLAGYNASKEKISVSNIIAKNYSNVVESSHPDFFTLGNGKIVYCSFNSSGVNAVLANVSIYGLLAGGTTLEFRIYNSTLVSGIYRPYDVNEYYKLKSPVDPGSTDYIRSNFNDLFLDPSNTTDNVWFLGVYVSGTGIQMYREYDSTNGDDSVCFGTENNDADFNNPDAIDYTLTVDFSLGTTTPTPSQIGLRVNGTLVENGTGNEGTWIREMNLDLEGKDVIYSFSAEWPKCSWDVDNVIINFTKSGLLSDPVNFTSATNENILWNITKAVSGFSPSFNNYSLIYTVPETWSYFDLYVDGSKAQDNCMLSSELGNGFKRIEVNATDGEIVLICSSPQYLQTMNLRVDGNDRNWVAWDEILDVVLNLPGPIDGDVNLSVYGPGDALNYTATQSVLQSDQITISWNVSASIMEYGNVSVRVYWYNHTEAFYAERNITVVAGTDFSFTGIADNEEVISTTPFNISWLWIDIYSDSPVGSGDGAFFNYSLDSGTWKDGTPSNPSTKEFNITLDPTALSFGMHTVDINMSGPLTDNGTYHFIFYIVHPTVPINSYSAAAVRGTNVSYTFQYLNQSNSNQLTGADIEAVNLDGIPFEWTFDEQAGQYTITVNSSAGDVGVYSLLFNISLNQYQTRLIEINLTILESPSDLTVNDYPTVLYRILQQNLTIDLTFVDHTTGAPITGVTKDDFIVYNAEDNSIWSGTGGWTVKEVSNGHYILNVSMLGINSGVYSIRFNVSKAPNHGVSVSEIISFRIIGNITEVSLFLLRDEGNNDCAVNGTNIFENNTLRFELFWRDLNNSRSIIIDDNTTRIWVLVDGEYLDASKVYGINFNLDNRYEGYINLTGITPGDHIMVLIIGRVNYENASFKLSFTLVPKFRVIVELVSDIPEIRAGRSFSLVFRLTYNDTINGQIVPLSDVDVSLYTVPQTTTSTETTNETGYVVFTITPSLDYNVEEKLKIYITIKGTYNVASSVYAYPSEGEGIEVLPAEVFPMIYVYILVGVLGAAIVIPVVKSKVIEPRKQARVNELMSASTMFEDAINVQHIMIIYKATGTSIFFKSFGEEEFDPDLISGFLSAVQSFGKEIKSKKGLNQMEYGDKVLLFSDGEFVRITLVLGKSPSPYLKRKLSELVGKFEVKYRKKLENWKGHLGVFRDAGALIDKVLNTSIILPHKLTENKTLKEKVDGALAKKIVAIAESMISSERPFVFISQIIEKAMEETGKDKAEIIMAINKLRDKEILIPLQIEKTEEEELDEDSLRELAAKVAKLPGKTDEEKKRILEELIELSPAEREVALSSLIQKVKITTKFSGDVVETKTFKDVKEVRKELDRILKEASKLIKKGEFDEAIKLYEIGEVLAYQWNLEQYGVKFGNLVVSTANDKLFSIIKENTKLAKKAEKEKDYNTALDKYVKAMEAAEELFKLGMTDLDSEIKELSKKVKFCEKKAGVSDQKEIVMDFKALKNRKKELEKRWKSIKKSDDYIEKCAVLSKMALISNLIFQFGHIEYSKEVNELKKKLESILEEIKNSEEIINKIADQVSMLNSKKEELLAKAKELEDSEQYIEAIVVYGQILEIYCRLGDIDNVFSLYRKITLLSDKVPNIRKIIKEFEEKAQSARSSGNEEEAKRNEMYAQVLREIFFLD